MTAYIAAPLLLCLVAVIRDMAASRRLHRWLYAEAPSPPTEVDEWLVSVSVECYAAEREGAALAELLRRRRLVE